MRHVINPYVSGHRHSRVQHRMETARCCSTVGPPFSDAQDLHLVKNVAEVADENLYIYIYILLYYTILYYTILYYTILYCTTLVFGHRTP